MRSDNNIAVRYAAPPQVLFDELQRSRIAIDKRHVRRAATERFDADGARPGVRIEHARKRSGPESVGALSRTRVLNSGDSALSFYMAVTSDK